MARTPQTTMIDIYEAAGGKVSEDRESVQLPPHGNQPFEITLRVIPVSHSFGYDGGEKVGFAILFKEDVYIQGMEMRYHNPVEFELPVTEVNIVKKEE